jgi:hypothetical protein
MLLDNVTDRLVLTRRAAIVLLILSRLSCTPHVMSTIVETCACLLHITDTHLVHGLLSEYAFGCEELTTTRSMHSTARYPLSSMVVAEALASMATRHHRGSVTW